MQFLRAEKISLNTPSPFTSNVRVMWNILWTKIAKREPSPHNERGKFHRRINIYSGYQIKNWKQRQWLNLFALTVDASFLAKSCCCCCGDCLGDFDDCGGDGDCYDFLDLQLYPALLRIYFHHITNKRKEYLGINMAWGRGVGKRIKSPNLITTPK